MLEQPLYFTNSFGKILKTQLPPVKKEGCFKLCYSISIFIIFVLFWQIYHSLGDLPCCIIKLLQFCLLFKVQKLDALFWAKPVMFFIPDRTPNTHDPGLVNRKCIKECKMERVLTDAIKFFFAWLNSGHLMKMGHCYFLFVLISFKVCGHCLWRNVFHTRQNTEHPWSWPCQSQVH